MNFYLKLENVQIIISKTIFVLYIEVEKKKRVIFGPIIKDYYKDPECKQFLLIVQKRKSCMITCHKQEVACWNSFIIHV